MRFEKVIVPALVVGLSGAKMLLSPVPFLDGGDGFNAILPLQVVGSRATLHGNFCWTDEIGLGHPLLNELNFQQANPLNLLYSVLDPILAFHIQVVIWLGLLALSAWFCLRRLFPRFGALEYSIYLTFVLNAGSFRFAMPYQVIFLSSFTIVPVVWILVRRIYRAPRLVDVALLAGATLLLIHTQYNFTIVPNLFVLGLISAYELHASGPRNRRNVVMFAILCALLLGFAVFHVFDVLEIHALSNRKELAVAEARFSASGLETNLEGLFGFDEWRLFGIVLAAAAFLRIRNRATPARTPALHLGLLLLLAGTCGFGLAIFNLPRHQARMSVLALFPAAIWLSLVGADLARRIVRLVGRRGDDGSLLAALALITIAATFCDLEPSEAANYPPTFDRVDRVRSALVGLFGGSLPDDLDRYRIGSVVEDDFQYKGRFLARSLYQPSQAAIYGFKESGYYGSYLLNGGRRPRTYEQVVTTQRFGTFGNLTALAPSGITDPILRLLNVKYLIAHETLAAEGLVARGTIPGQDPSGFERQYLYELRRPLPRIWAVPLPAEAAAALDERPFAEASDATEVFLRTALGDGTIDERSAPISVTRTGCTLRLAVAGATPRPALVFIAMPYWPAWTAKQSGVRPLAPFGLTALVVRRDDGDAIDLEFRPTTAPAKIAGVALLIAALGASAYAARRFTQEPGADV